MRKPLVVGNWKMNGDRQSTESLCTAMATAKVDANLVDVALCPPFPLLDLANQLLATSQIDTGAQDVDQHDAGAYTGQVSAALLKNMGCNYAIVGHSERREYFSEGDELIAAKVAKAIDNDLVAILCVGESLQQRTDGTTLEVVGAQLASVLNVLDDNVLNKLVVAYEPVWAIGTGQTATPEQAQAVHHALRAQLRAHNANAADCKILYGGSMKAENAQSLLAQADIDGGLIGGAALDAQAFTSICQFAAASAS